LKASNIDENKSANSDLEAVVSNQGNWMAKGGNFFKNLFKQ
jgi:hypothetical protein